MTVNRATDGPDLQSWRRSALLAGAVATALWIVQLVPVVRHGPSVDQNLWVGVAALVLSFLTTHLLGRTFSDPSFEHRGRARLGRRLAHGFELLFAAALALTLFGVQALSLVGAVLACSALACFLASLALAVPAPVRR